ncbi:S8 family serine peptidase [Listeria booriae]|nr:S8 family serine peptidase [Listeria booriae]STY45960.1 Thermophilic serine proteinase precursor [Listeria booriae]
MKTFKIGGAAFIIASALFLAGGNTYAEELSPVKEKIISEFQEETIDQEQEKLAKGEENLIYVQFKAGISATEKLAFERTFELKNKIDIGSAEIYQYRLPDQVVSEEVLVALNQSDIINFAEPEYKVTPSQEAIDLSGIWGFQNIEFPGIDANVSPAWNYTKGSPEVVVAVIDSGIDLNHPALKDRIWVNKDEIPGDGIDNDKNGYIDDENGWNFNQNNNDLMDTMGHGTHVSGIIAAGQQAINSSK